MCDIFEDISNDTKRSKFISTVDTVQDKVDPCTQVALAQVQRKLFAVSTNVISMNVFEIKKKCYMIKVTLGYISWSSDLDLNGSFIWL